MNPNWDPSKQSLPSNCPSNACNWLRVPSESLTGMAPTNLPFFPLTTTDPMIVKKRNPVNPSVSSQAVASSGTMAFARRLAILPGGLGGLGSHIGLKLRQPGARLAILPSRKRWPMRCCFSVRYAARTVHGWMLLDSSDPRPDKTGFQQDDQRSGSPGGQGVHHPVENRLRLEALEAW
ncbi:hypothetical protein BO70DRAFT_393863 [Aspergillus heteromorphus CBS 117.55]|uniref:Uncharacterized protein n=1 Tax=Aspergillus heteromorphus CBS 117.55 TaxID=1448321 RepID=A0A317WR15_9EURO|nr:uncharacterized protein BO70DRAFT_393863 [Aspergillus heteromorphus CBS 117.55]PWY88141.1 hypothetical protein BO70DRAFT_393863 [Aspergillus heteromorphus CBS 117.55]